MKLSPCAAGSWSTALTPAVQHAYEDLAGAGERVRLQYRSEWEPPLSEALRGARRDDLRRGVSTVGPHRDELWIELDDMAARTHASQGEQRCLALSLRLAAHREITTERGTAPVLLLDDVFSELDPQRCAALVAALPPGQVFVSTAGELPDSILPEAVVEVSCGKLHRSRAVALRSWAGNHFREAPTRWESAIHLLVSGASWVLPDQTPCRPWIRTGTR